MKLIDKPLTERQKKFAGLYALDKGLKSNTEIAIEAGYPKSSAYQRAHELLNPEICPHVVKYIREVEKDVQKKFDLNIDSHLKTLLGFLLSSIILFSNFFPLLDPIFAFVFIEKLFH